jgi:demethylmenaquinone methyltransferase/2-methoxy-6-polyprenyl-1,4-benzoquinol methylase
VDEPVLQEQMRYYRERAAEYDATALGDDGAALHPLGQELRTWPAKIMARLAPCEQALELACGTGIWTRALLTVARRVRALDASPEMLALNRAKIADARVRYQLADLFTWEPDAPVDLAFAALWFSHVPAERLSPMLSALRRAVRSGGQLCIIDEPDTSPVRPPTAADPDLEMRELRDGRQFQIVKIYRSPQRLAALCVDAGFTQASVIPETYFFGLIAQ